ncbi:MAG: hypothetical protein HY320_12660 [Armatimonadetes bacterium]|nr:hypothetical protein [Armatimonadota bacterium]
MANENDVAEKIEKIAERHVDALMQIVSQLPPERQQQLQPRVAELGAAVYSIQRKYGARRITLVQIRLSLAERNLLEAHARAAHQSLSAYIRQKCNL